METFSALLAICAVNSPVPGDSPHKGQWRGALIFSLICVWINGWVNNREAGDLRHHRAYYDVTVMITSNTLQHVSLLTTTWLISPWTKWPPFRGRFFQMHFLQWTWIDFDENFTKVYSQWSNQQYHSIVSDNGFAPPDEKPLFGQGTVRLLTHICVTRPQ